MRTATLAIAALAVLAAAPLHAQAPAVDLNLVPKIGYFVPLSDLTTARGTFEDVETKLKNSFAIGLAAELDVLLLPVDLRANLEYAMDTGIEDVDGSDGTLLVLTGDLVFRPLPTPFLQPYLIGGAGIKQYDLSFGTLGDEDSSDLTLHLGAGLDLKFGPLSIMAEASDYISWFEQATSSDSSSKRIQNDVFVMIGFRVGLL